MSPMFIGIILILGTGVAVLLVFLVKSFLVPHKIAGIEKLIASGKAPQAIRQARALITRNPRDAEAHYLLDRLRSTYEKRLALTQRLPLT